MSQPLCAPNPIRTTAVGAKEEHQTPSELLLQEQRRSTKPHQNYCCRSKGGAPNPIRTTAAGAKEEHQTPSELLLQEQSLGVVALEPRTQSQLLDSAQDYFCDLSLDPNTVNGNLKLSDNNKKVTRVTEKQPYPDHRDIFNIWSQILCSTGLTGRCYWEVQWSERVSISVSYRTVRWKGVGFDSLFGQNDQSWSLECSEGGFYVCHNKKQTLLPQPRSSSGRVAVFVDCPAGSLSFYTVSSDQLTHLHTFTTTFTHTLITGFRLWSEDSSVSLCAPTDSLSSL
ncbi:stonustoxin subunit beta-like [Boleophthalmus pectinirostris]|uniref:stonustoxin subunit beta-like n=1 Tax=Boleophthalmus pectinirostris TaxID=150288 RepID=UPI0024312F2C|nr:stonustoxin subunit beta-like [Boleophthalmus pectinirostris]